MIEPYIIIAQQEWALDLGSNARNLAIECSKDRPVMYVNPAIDIRTIYKQIKTPHGKQRLKLAMGLGKNTVQPIENVWVHTPSTINSSISWIRNFTIYSFFNKRNAKGFFKSLQKAVEGVGWQNEQCIVLNDSQMFTGLYTKEYFKPLLSFYYLRDNLVEHPYFKLHGSKIEPLTIKLADAVFANSAYLTNYASNYHALSLNIGQGCELEMYDATKQHHLPEDMENIAKPRIGYIGFLTATRLDIDLLEELAVTNKEWQWVYIGPEEEQFKQSKLHDLPNVHFLGSKAPALLPGYIQHLDVCHNPQLINSLTVGNYPRKIDEYLAMGKATVATKTPAMEMFLPHVHLAKGIKEYKEAIINALLPQTNSEVEMAIAFAKSHTWKACLEKIYSIQKKLLYA